MKNIFIRLCIILAVQTMACVSFGQEQSGVINPYGSEYAFQLGTLLPNQIKGMTEIMPVWAFRYSYPLQFGALEPAFANSHAEGVDFNLLSLDIRGDIPLDKDLVAFAYAGPNLTYYSEKNQTKRESIYGVEAGGGVMVKLLEAFWLRTELRFTASPGTSLYLGFGFCLRTPPSGAGG